MYHGQWYGKGDGWGALATLAALQHQLATGKGWGKNFDKGYKGGKKGKAAWTTGGKSGTGEITWGGAGSTLAMAVSKLPGAEW